MWTVICFPCFPNVIVKKCLKRVFGWELVKNVFLRSKTDNVVCVILQYQITLLWAGTYRLRVFLKQTIQQLWITNITFKSNTGIRIRRTHFHFKEICYAYTVGCVKTNCAVEYITAQRELFKSRDECVWIIANSQLKLANINVEYSWNY